jgi:hypothetical protein
MHTAVSEKPVEGDAEFAWEAKGIGKVIDRSPRQAIHMLAKGEIKCARKKGGRYVANVAALRKEFGA